MKGQQGDVGPTTEGLFITSTTISIIVPGIVFSFHSMTSKILVPTRFSRNGTVSRGTMWCSSTWRSSATRINRTTRRHGTSGCNSTTRRRTMCGSMLEALGLKRHGLVALETFLAGDWTCWYAALRYVSCHRSCRLSYNLPPLVRRLRGVCLELQLMTNGEAIAQLALRRVLALHVELLTTDGTDHAIRQIERELRYRIFGEVVISLEFVQELGRCDDVVVGVIGAHDLALALEGASDEGLSCAMVLVGKVDLRDGAGGRGWVDQDLVVALDKAVPLEIQGHTLSSPDHVPVRCLRMLSLRVHDLHELSHAMLDCLDDMRFELCERILYANEILTVSVLFLHLLVQAVHDTALQNVWVVCSLHVAAVRVKRGCVRSEQFDVLLSVCAGLIDRFAALPSTLGQLLGFILNLRV